MGDGGTGKTTVLHRYLTGGFKPDTKMTIGVAFSLKEDIIKIKRREMIGDSLVTFQLWDFGGQERFRFLLSSYFVGTNGALLVFDITRPITFESIPVWLNLCYNSLGKDYLKKCPIILVGNKDDLRSDTRYDISREQALNKASELGFPYIECSAKTGKNIKEVFEMLGTMILEKSFKSLIPTTTTIPTSKSITSHKFEDVLDEFIGQFNIKDFTFLDKLFSIIEKSDFTITTSPRLTKAFRIIQLLESNIKSIKNNRLALNCISILYYQISCYYSINHNVDNSHEYRYKSLEALIEQTFNEEKKYDIAMIVVKWFWQNLCDLLNIDKWFERFKKHQKVFNLCLAEGDQLFSLALDAFKSLKAGDVDLVDKYEKNLIEIRDLFPEEKEILKLADKAFYIIRNSLPIGRILKYRFNPLPLISGSPATLLVSLKNNTPESKDFIIEINSAGFKQKKDIQKRSIESKGQLNMSFLLGKVKATSQKDLSTQIRLFEGNMNIIEEFFTEMPQVLMRSDLEQALPNIYAVEADSEKIVLDKTATVVLRVKISNPTNISRTIKLDLDAPKFITTHNDVFSPRVIPPSNKETPNYVTESIILGTPSSTGKYNIHLKLLDENGNVIPNSDKDVSFNIKISRKKKAIKFLKGVITIASVLK